jgi:hypothetical protein
MPVPSCKAEPHLAEMARPGYLGGLCRRVITTIFWWWRASRNGHNEVEAEAQAQAQAMSKHPVASNFYADASEAAIEVIFAPTRSRYTYSRLLDSGLDLLSPSPIVHAGKMDGSSDYEPAEVQAMAYRVALSTARRLVRSAPRGSR